MNTTKAASTAMANTRTWAEVLELIDSSDKSGLCSNGQTLRSRAADTAVAQILKNDLTLVPDGTKYSEQLGKEVMTGEGMLIMNILKEFA